MDKKEEFRKDLEKVIKKIKWWTCWKMKKGEEVESGWQGDLIDDYADIFSNKDGSGGCIVDNIGGFYYRWMDDDCEVLKFLGKWEIGE